MVGKFSLEFEEDTKKVKCQTASNEENRKHDKFLVIT